MNAKDLSYALVAALEDGDVELLDGNDEAIEVQQARTFADLDLLTHSDGLVLKLEGGEEFHVTIAQAA